MSENNHPLSHERGHNPLLNEGIGDRLREFVPSYEDILANVHAIDPQVIVEGEAFITAMRSRQSEAATATAIDTDAEATNIDEEPTPVNPTPVANVALTGVMEDAGMLVDDTAEQALDYPEQIAPDDSDLSQDDFELAGQ
jgi:hypothetical protein